ncbi:MAG: GNAT family N-acetyltransferase [Planktomarina sp.]
MIRIEETTDISTCHDIRKAVFVVEQNVPEDLEIDGEDDVALHVLARSGQTPVGTARVLMYGTTAKIGRVCVLKSHRGKGIGAVLIEECQNLARGKGATRAILGAQVSAIGFYEQLGYRAYGDVFDDAGIPHKMMEASL